MQKENYTVPEFCETYNISHSTLYRMWRDNEGPPKVKVRGRTFVPFDGAKKWWDGLQKAHT